MNSSFVETNHKSFLLIIAKLDLPLQDFTYYCICIVYTQAMESYFLKVTHYQVKKVQLQNFESKSLLSFFSLLFYIILKFLKKTVFF